MKKILIKKENNKAITLIALVITIVVLIILAAVAINLSMGENGLFSRARFAKESYKNAEAKEKLDIDNLTNSVGSMSISSANRDEVVSKADYDALVLRVQALENKTTMKQIIDVRTSASVNIPNSTKTVFSTLTIPEDCYAFVYARYTMTNMPATGTTSSSASKSISIYLGDTYLAGNSFGGSGTSVIYDVSFVREFKAGDVIKASANQWTGTAQTISEYSFIVRYFPKSALVEGN